MAKHNSSNPEYLYHITQSQVPDSKFKWEPKKQGSQRCYLEPKVPRICFSKSVAGCFITLGDCLDPKKDIFVLRTIKPVHYYTPTASEVIDAKITEEVWRLAPVTLEKIYTLSSKELSKQKIKIFDYLSYNAGEEVNLSWQKTAKSIVKDILKPLNLMNL
jgi:hypothetical protein